MKITNFKLRDMLFKTVYYFNRLQNLGRLHPLSESVERALKRSVDYIDLNMSTAMGLRTQKELMNFSLDETTAAGYFLEFGVFSGGTIRHMAKRKPNIEFHGFDNFESLPEHWSGTPLIKNTFSRKGSLPKVRKNVRLHKGWFNESLPIWLTKHPGAVAFIHIDCDIYSSTVDILENLADRIQVGTIVLFDEYFNYPNWENHEFKAWQEFIIKYGISYKYIGYAYEQVAVKITAIKIICKDSAEKVADLHLSESLI